MSQKNSNCVSMSDYNRAISVAFQKDVEYLLTEFERKKSFKFQDFAAVWRDLKFSYIFSEQYYYTFIKSFMENAFFVLKKFIMFPKNVFTEVGTLYLLYAIYFKQTLKEWIKIRLTLEEYQKLQDLLQRLRFQTELEPLFVYDKLKKANAFEYVFQRTVLGPELQYLKNCTDFVDDTFQSISAGGYQQDLKYLLSEGNFLENFRKTTETYQEALSTLSINNPGLGSFSSTLLEDLNSLLGNKND